mgnify:CR=1 FL=1
MVVDGQPLGAPDGRDEGSRAAYVPGAVVVDDRFDWGEDVPPTVPWAETVIYETHVRNITKGHPEIPEPVRGTYAAMAHPATITNLQALGMTSVELLPVQWCTHDTDLLHRGLVDRCG